MIFSITDHLSAFQAGFASVIIAFLLGFVVGQVVNLIKYA